MTLLFIELPYLFVICWACRFCCSSCLESECIFLTITQSVTFSTITNETTVLYKGREEIMIVGQTMWTQSTSVTDRQTDRQTELQ